MNRIQGLFATRMTLLASPLSTLSPGPPLAARQAGVRLAMAAMTDRKGVSTGGMATG